VAPLPIYAARETRARRDIGGRIGKDMGHFPRLPALAGVRYLKLAPIREHEHARVPGLAAALRIEERAVQDHPSRGGAGHHGIEAGGIGVVPEQQLGHFPSFLKSREQELMQ